MEGAEMCDAHFEENMEAFEINMIYNQFFFFFTLIHFSASHMISSQLDAYGDMTTTLNGFNAHLNS